LALTWLRDTRVRRFRLRRREGGVFHETGYLFSASFRRQRRGARAEIALGVLRNAPASWSAAVLCRLELARRYQGCFPAPAHHSFAIARDRVALRHAPRKRMACLIVASMLCGGRETVRQPKAAQGSFHYTHNFADQARERGRRPVCCHPEELTSPKREGDCWA